MKCTTFLTNKETVEPLASIMALVLWYSSHCRDRPVYMLFLSQKTTVVHSMVSSPFQSAEYFFSPFSDFMESADVSGIESLSNYLFSAVFEDIFTGTMFSSFPVSRIFISCLHLQLLKILSTTWYLGTNSKTLHTNIHLLYLLFTPVLRSSVSQIQEDFGSCLLSDTITTLAYETCKLLRRHCRYCGFHVFGRCMRHGNEMVVHGVSTSGQI